MNVKIAGAALAAIVLGYLGWGLWQNAHKKPLPPPAAVVVAPSPAPAATVAPVKPAPAKESDGL